MAKRTHLRVKDLIEQLQKMPPEAKVVFINDNIYENGMYYATSVELHEDDSDELPKEDQVEIGTNYATQAYGWECLNN